MTGASTSGWTSSDRWQRLVERSGAFWRRTAPVRRRLRTLWREMIRVLLEQGPLTGATSPAPGPSGPVVAQLDTPVPIRVSGKGRRFNFHVHARCIWSSRNARRATLLSYAHYYMGDVTPKLTRLAARHALAFAPDQAAELEAQLQLALAERGPWIYQRGDTVVACEPHVWVEVEERVWAVVRPYWEKLLTLDYEEKVDRRRAETSERSGVQPEASAESVADGSAGGEADPARPDPARALRQVAADLRAVAQRIEDLCHGPFG